MHAKIHPFKLCRVTFYIASTLQCWISHYTHSSMHPNTHSHIRYITDKNVLVCWLLYTYWLKLHGINYITLHHIISRCTAFIDTKNNANRGTCIHRSVHACTLAYTHKYSPLSDMTLPLLFLFALQRAASIHTYR